MKNIPGTEYIHYHKKIGLFQITKKINGVLKSFGYGKTLIIVLMKRDWVIGNNWKPYPRNTKTNERHIRFVDNHYKVMKRICGKYKTYGSFNTLTEAVKYRDFIVSKGWSTNYIYKNSMRYIHKRNNAYHIYKSINSDLIYFGSFKSLEEAQNERDILEKVDWDFDKLVEYNDGGRVFLGDKISTRVLFETFKKRRDWY